MKKNFLLFISLIAFGLSPSAFAVGFQDVKAQLVGIQNTLADEMDLLNAHILVDVLDSQINFKHRPEYEDPVDIKKASEAWYVNELPKDIQKLLQVAVDARLNRLALVEAEIASFQLIEDLSPSSQSCNSSGFSKKAAQSPISRSSNEEDSFHSAHSAEGSRDSFRSARSSFNSPSSSPRLSSSQPDGLHRERPIHVYHYTEKGVERVKLFEEFHVLGDGLCARHALGIDNDEMIRRMIRILDHGTPSEKQRLKDSLLESVKKYFKVTREAQIPKDGFHHYITQGLKVDFLDHDAAHHTGNNIDQKSSEVPASGSLAVALTVFGLNARVWNLDPHTGNLVLGFKSVNDPSIGFIDLFHTADVDASKGVVSNRGYHYNLLVDQGDQEGLRSAAAREQIWNAERERRSKKADQENASLIKQMQLEDAEREKQLEKANRASELLTKQMLEKEGLDLEAQRRALGTFKQRNGN